MANLICAKCNGIINADELIECPHCWEIYHRECWEDISNCVTCKKYNPIFESAQAQKEMKKEEQEKSEEREKEYDEVQEDDESISPPTPNNIMSLVSNAVLVLGAVLGIAVAISFMTGGIKGVVIGVVIGAVIAAAGWVLSVLINGFGELIANSQKTNYLLQKLVEKNEEKGVNQWED